MRSPGVSGFLYCELLSRNNKLGKIAGLRSGGGDQSTLLHIVTNIATAATAITPAVAQPSHLSNGGLTRSPITFRLLVRSTTKTISGGASTPFRTADQNNIFTALKPA